MKIWSKHRPGTYWIESSSYGQADRFGHREMHKGLLVEFTTLGGPGAGSLLDTIEYQAKQGWSDETREAVEGYLQGHRDWGLQLFLADDAMAANERPEAGCEVMTIIHGGVRVCGRPVAAKGDLCDVHSDQQMARAIAPSDVVVPPMPDAPVGVI